MSNRCRIFVISLVFATAEVSGQDFWRATYLPQDSGEFGICELTVSVGVTSHGNIFASVRDHGLYRSTNEGDSWEHLLFADRYESPIAIDRQDNIYFMGDSGLVVSNDGGDTWFPRPAQGSRVSGGDMIVDTAGTLFVHASYLGVLRSRDQGRTWDTVHTAEDWYASFLCTKRGTLLYFSEKWQKTMYRSTDAGDTWTSTALPHEFEIGLAEAFASDSTTGDIYNVGRGFFDLAIQRSTDDGLTWQPEKIDEYPITIFANSAGHLFISTGSLDNGKAFRSRDRGVTWEDISSGLVKWNDTLTFAELPDGRLVAGSCCGRIYISTSSATAIGRERNVPPSGLNLSIPYPDPTHENSNLTITVSTFSHITLGVFDVLGRERMRVLDEHLTPGTYKRSVNVTSLPAGVYFIRLSNGAISKTCAVRVRY